MLLSAFLCLVPQLQEIDKIKIAGNKRDFAKVISHNFKSWCRLFRLAVKATLVYSFTEPFPG